MIARQKSGEESTLNKISFFVPLKKIPTTTHQQKKVRVVNGKPMFYEDDQLKEARSKFMAYLAPHVPDEKLKGPIRMKAMWLFPKGARSRHGQWKTTRPDVDNSMKLVLDCMTELGYWQDDAHVSSLTVEKLFADVSGIYFELIEMEVLA